MALALQVWAELLSPGLVATYPILEFASSCCSCTAPAGCSTVRSKAAAKTAAASAGSFEGTSIPSAGRNRRRTARLAPLKIFPIVTISKWKKLICFCRWLCNYKAKFHSDTKSKVIHFNVVMEIGLV